jgi:signal transduction histidine kinase
MARARSKLYSYAAVVAAYAIVLGWWLYFFAHQSEVLVERVQRGGVTLTAEQIQALRDASDASLNMLLAEGLFLGVLLLASVALVLRSLQKELELHRQERNFLSAVTHELRSPIASARLYVESLLFGRAEGEKRERYLKNARADLDRLAGIVDDILESARMSNAGPVIRKERLDLAAFAAQAVGELARTEPLSGASIEIDAPRPVAVEADAGAVKTILRNLLSNAAKYGGSPAHIVVSVAHAQDAALLTVRDFGPGLNGTGPKDIFDPFVRGGDELVRTRQGVGLGLYMVAELARAHSGSARALTHLDGGGFAVEISLPAAREANGR